MGIIEIEKNLISDIVEGRSFLSKSKQSNGILSKLGNLIPGITSKAEEKNTPISSSQKSSSTYTTSSSLSLIHIYNRRNFRIRYSLNSEDEKLFIFDNW